MKKRLYDGLIGSLLISALWLGWHLWIDHANHHAVVDYLEAQQRTRTPQTPPSPAPAQP